MTDQYAIACCKSYRQLNDVKDFLRKHSISHQGSTHFLSHTDCMKLTCTVYNTFALISIQPRGVDVRLV